MVIPKVLRDQVLNELHVGYPGIVQMKSLARLHVWWPGIDEDISRVICGCSKCQMARNRSPKAPCAASVGLA